MATTKTSIPAQEGSKPMKSVKAAAALKLSESAVARKLVERYNDAIKQSKRVGRPVSFRVVIDPSEGEPIVSAIEEASISATPAFPVDESAEPEAGLAVALTAARERGQTRAAEILAGDDMLNADAFAQILGTTRATVNAKRQSGHLLGLDGAKRGYRFPVWQLDADGRPYADLSKLFDRLGRSPWAVYRFLTSPHGELDGRTGLEVLRRGGAASALAVAESVSRGDFR